MELQLSDMVNMKEKFERFKKQCQDDKDDAFLKQQDDKDDAFLKCQHIIDELRSSISEGTRVQELEGIRKVQMMYLIGWSMI